MAATTTIINGPEVPGSRKQTTATVLFDSSYATGGEAVTIADLGFTRLDWLDVSAGNGYLAAWDGSLTSPKILLYRQTSATSALIEVPSATDVSTITVRVMAFGA